jgi:hypothetical protein
MRTALLWILALAAIQVAHAQAGQTVDPSQADRTYSLLREDEDWSFLQDPSLRQDFWDPIKYIRLGAQGWFLTIGGEAREAFEQVGNDNWEKQNYTNTFFLERYMLHTDWHLGKYVRVFVQLKSGLESFRTGGPRPIDEKKLDFEAAFIEVGSTAGDNWVVLQAGRQELNYGSGRLVSVREGPDVRQSFDGAKLKASRRLARRLVRHSPGPRQARLLRQCSRPCNRLLGRLCNASVAAADFNRQLLSGLGPEVCHV